MRKGAKWQYVRRAAQLNPSRVVCVNPALGNTWKLLLQFSRPMSHFMLYFMPGTGSTTKMTLQGKHKLIIAQIFVLKNIFSQFLSNTSLPLGKGFTHQSRMAGQKCRAFNVPENWHTHSKDHTPLHLCSTVLWPYSLSAILCGRCRLLGFVQYSDELYFQAFSLAAI